MARHPVRLAATPARVLGALTIEPGHRRVSWPGGERILEPRVMQVLVALAEADGAVVGRDDLVARCWDGRIVGENAINRVISLLRDLAADSGTFRIETITKVGYRLAPTDSGPGEALTGAASHPEPPAPAPLAPRSFPRRALLAGGVAAMAAAGAAWWGGRRAVPPREAVELTRHAIDNYRAGGLPDEQVIAQLEEAVRLAPDYAEAWGMLAFAHGNRLAGPPARPGLGPEERMRAAAARALALDPDEPRAHAALMAATPSYGNWSRMEPQLQQLAGRTDAHPAVVGQLGNLMQEVGRFGESLPLFRRITGSLVINPVGHMRLVQGLWGSGDEEGATTLLALVERRFPGNAAIWPAAVRLRLFGPRPAEALALLDPSHPATATRHPEELAALRATAEALVRPDSASRADALRALEQMSEPEKAVWTFVPALVAVGADSHALEALEGHFLRRGPRASLHPSSRFGLSTRFLFLPPMRRLWEEPRFGRLLVEAGLESYWRGSGTVPDFRRLTGRAP